MAFTVMMKSLIAVILLASFIGLSVQQGETVASQNDGNGTSNFNSIDDNNGTVKATANDGDNTTTTDNDVSTTTWNNNSTSTVNDSTMTTANDRANATDNVDTTTTEGDNTNTTNNYNRTQTNNSSTNDDYNTTTTDDYNTTTSGEYNTTTTEDYNTTTTDDYNTTTTDDYTTTTKEDYNTTTTEDYNTTTTDDYTTTITDDYNTTTTDDYNTTTTDDYNTSTASSNDSIVDNTDTPPAENDTTTLDKSNSTATSTPETTHTLTDNNNVNGNHRGVTSQCLDQYNNCTASLRKEGQSYCPAFRSAKPCIQKASSGYNSQCTLEEQWRLEQLDCEPSMLFSVTTNLTDTKVGEACQARITECLSVSNWVASLSDTFPFTKLFCHVTNTNTVCLVTGNKGVPCTKDEYKATTLIAKCSSASALISSFILVAMALLVQTFGKRLNI